MTREEAIMVLKNEQPHCGKKALFPEEKKYEAYNRAIKALEQETSDDTISLGVFEQVMWERDVAIDQLKELGYGFGEKIRIDDDLISRQAVDTLVDELARAISDERCCMSRGRSTATIMQDILDLPSVTPKQRTGHWIVLQKDEWDSASLNHIKCSECGKEPFGDVSSYFCPNCGADMRGAKMVEPQDSCHTCKHKEDGWDSEYCDGCCDNHSRFEPQESEE